MVALTELLTVLQPDGRFEVHRRSGRTKIHPPRDGAERWLDLRTSGCGLEATPARVRSAKRGGCGGNEARHGRRFGAGRGSASFVRRRLAAGDIEGSNRVLKPRGVACAAGADLAAQVALLRGI